MLIDDLEFYRAAIKAIPANLPDYDYPAEAFEDGVCIKSTEWQEGYNAACKEFRKAAWEYVKQCKSADDVFRAKVILSAAGETYSGEPFALNMNDMFYWGCADSEDVPDAEVLTVYRIWKEVEGDGLLAWVCLKRGEMPQEPVLRSRADFDKTMEQVRAIVAEEAVRGTSGQTEGGS